MSANDPILCMILGVLVSANSFMAFQAHSYPLTPSAFQRQCGGQVDYAIEEIPGPTQREGTARSTRRGQGDPPTGPSRENLVRPRAWGPFGNGFEFQGTGFVCDNGSQAKARRGMAQTVELNQARPEPIVAVCESRAEAVTGTADSDYALYLDLTYADDTPLWGQVASFSTGTHDWQRRQVVVLPEKPVKRVSFYMLLRGHAGKAWFRNPALRVVRTPAGACLFDGVPVIPRGLPARDSRYATWQPDRTSCGSSARDWG